MLAVRTVSAETLEYTEVAQPTANAGCVIVSIDYVALCGTDLHIWEDDYTTQLPLIQGHELVGTVAELGVGTQGFTIGDRVAIDPLIACGSCKPCQRGRGNVCADLVVLGCYCDGGLTERISVAAQRLHRLADDLPTHLGALAEPTAIALEAVTRGRANPQDTALVLGAGPIGLLATLALHDLGARVIAADVIADRLDMARAFGAAGSLLIDPDRPFPHEELTRLLGAEAAGGPDVVIEATGVPQSLENALLSVAPAGRVVQVGISPNSTSFPLSILPFKEVDLLGSRNSQGLIPDALALIGRHSKTVDELITHRFSVRCLDRAFRAMRDPNQRVGKILIEMPKKESEK